MNVAISGTVAPASARRTTADPRRSWKVRPSIFALAQSFAQDVRKPSDVHGNPLVLVSINVLRRGVRSRYPFRDVETGMTTVR